MLEILPAIQGAPALDECFAIRMEVFVREQGVAPEEELDALDDTATHVLALWNGTPAGTARAVETEPGWRKIGRVAVRAEFRKCGIGAGLMRGIEAMFPGHGFVLTAQTQALGFYQKLGYVAQGAEFLEAGIPHYLMRKPAPAG